MARRPVDRESGAGEGNEQFNRRPGEPFEDRRVELYAQNRAAGRSVRQSADAAGVGTTRAATWERSPEVHARIGEFATAQQVVVTASPAWVVEQLKQNAIKAQDEGKYKDSTDALELLYKILKTDPDVIAGVARALPVNKPPTPEELTKRLSAASGAPQPIAAEGEEVYS
jgi:chromosome condensin MukBEF ATPase and DNA-binding subunit MukB